MARIFMGAKKKALIKNGTLMMKMPGFVSGLNNKDKEGHHEAPCSKVTSSG